MNNNQARLIAKLAHKGQNYGSADYFEFHVNNVVRRCENNDHCVYGHLTVAWLHDVVEDTELTLDDLRTLGLDERLLDAVDAITKRKDEDYAAYLTRVLDDPIATFVKYHDLRENMHQCTAIVTGYADPVNKARSKGLLRSRYTPALERIIESKPFWYHE